MLTMKEIDALREQVKVAVETYRKLKDEVEQPCPECGTTTAPWFDTDLAHASDAILQLRKQIEGALAARRESPPCPFCKGPMLPTGTYGRRECFDCGATALVGRCIAQKVE